MNLKQKMLKNADSRKAGIICTAIGVVAIVIGIVICLFAQGEFNCLNGSGNTIEVIYLEGPCCGYYDDNDNLELGIYTGVDTYGYCVVIATDKQSGINLYGVDFNTEEEYNSLTPITFTGKATEIESELKPFLAEFYEISEDEVYDYFGDYYLDTTQSSIGAGSIILWILGAIILLVGIITFSDSKKKLKGLEAKLNEMEKDGSLYELEVSFNGESMSYSTLLCSNDYVIDMADAKGNFSVYSLKDYNNVYKCNIVNGAYSFTTYIALENDNGRILIGATTKENEDFYNIIDYLKANVSVKEAQ